MTYLIAVAIGLLCAISITILFGLIAMSGRRSRREEGYTVAQSKRDV
jgi:hypothetical protein